MRQAARTDRNHADIRTTLRTAGYYVHDMARFGSGFPDFLTVSKSGITVLLEAKMPGCTLTPDEESFFHKFPGPCFKVYSADDALGIMATYDRMSIE